MKNKINFILKRSLIGCILALAIFVASVKPAHANPLAVAGVTVGIPIIVGFITNTINSWVSNHLSQSAYTQKMNESWDATLYTNVNYRFVEVTGDELYDLCFQLNQAGCPCKVHRFQVDGVSYYGILGQGIISYENSSSVLVSTGYNNSGKYLVWTWLKGTSLPNDIVWSRVVSRYDPVNYIADSIDDGISGINTAIGSSATYGTILQRLKSIDDRIGLVSNETADSLTEHVYYIGNGIWRQVEFIRDFFRDDFPVFSTTLFTKLDSIITALGNVSGGTDYSTILSGIDSKLTTLNTTLSGITDKLDHLICQHDYTSMAYLDGNSVSFSGIAGEPLDDLQVTVLPSQDTHGYDFAWPEGGGVNYLPAHNNNESYSDGTPDGVAVIHSEGDGTYSILAIGDRESSFTHEFQLPQPVTVVSGSYFALGNGSYIDPSVSVYLAIDGNTKLFEGVSPTSANRVFQIPNGGTVTAIGFYIDAGSGDHAIAFQPMLTILSQDALVWSPYSNPAPINGYPDFTITHNSTQHNVEFPDALGNLYGGVYDVETGLLTVNYYTIVIRSSTDNLIRGEVESVTSSNSIYHRSVPIARCRLEVGYASGAYPLATATSDPLQSGGKYSHGSYGFDWSGGYYHGDVGSRVVRLYLPCAATWDSVDAYLATQSRAGTPVQLCYPLADPITYQLSPLSIQVVNGENIFSVDHGTISFGYLDASQLIDLGYTMVLCRKCGEYQPFFNYAALMLKLVDLEQTLADQRVDLSTDIGHLNESVDAILNWLDNEDLATNSTVVQVVNNYAIDIDLGIGNFTHILDLFVVAFDVSWLNADWLGAMAYFDTLGLDPVIPEGA